MRWRPRHAQIERNMRRAHARDDDSRLSLEDAKRKSAARTVWQLAAAQQPHSGGPVQPPRIKYACARTRAFGHHQSEMCLDNATTTAARECAAVCWKARMHAIIASKGFQRDRRNGRKCQRCCVCGKCLMH